MFLLRSTPLGVRYGLNVDAMLAETTPEQLNEWIAYHQLEPWGDEWVQTATIASAIHNAQGNSSVSPLDFIPGQTERSEGLSDEELHEYIKQKHGAK
jgi:hypothetical protein